jgi:hypothetical protein
MRVLVTLALLGFCFGTEVFLLPTFSVMISSWGGGNLSVWATAPLGAMPWILGPVTIIGAVMIVRAEGESRSAIAATALARVDVVLVLWVISIGLFLLDVVVTIPSLSR